MKKALFFLFALGMAVVLYRFPRMVESSIPSIYYVTPSQKTYENVLSCTGTLQAGEIYEVYLSSAAIPQRVPVSVGDQVTQGQLLLELTPSSLLSRDTLAMLRSYGQSASPFGDVDLGSVAALYGLSRTLGGGLTDYTDLAELLQLLQEERLSRSQADLLESGETRVYSPVSGIVTGVMVRESVPALPGVPLITVSDTSSFKVLAAVPEEEIARVKVGDKARVWCVGSSMGEYAAIVTRIFPTAHKVLRGTTTETVVDVELELEESNETLKPGFTARVNILAGEDYTMLTVPYEAIRQDENNNEYVYVYQDGKLKKNPVITGKELTNEVEILSGLDPDSIVIYNPGEISGEGTIIHLKGRADVT